MPSEFQTTMERLRPLWQDVSDPEQLTADTVKKSNMLNKLTNNGKNVDIRPDVLTTLALFLVQEDRDAAPVSKQYGAHCGMSMTAFNKARKSLQSFLAAGPQTPRSTRSTPRRTPASSPSKSQQQQQQRTPTRSSPTKRALPTTPTDAAQSSAKRARLSLMQPRLSSGSKRDAEMDEMHAQQQQQQQEGGSARRPGLRSRGAVVVEESPSTAASSSRTGSPTKSARSARSREAAASDPEATPTKSRAPTRKQQQQQQQQYGLQGEGAGEQHEDVPRGPFAASSAATAELLRQAQDREALDAAEALEAEEAKRGVERVSWDFEFSFDWYTQDVALLASHEDWKKSAALQIRAAQQQRRNL